MITTGIAQPVNEIDVNCTVEHARTASHGDTLLYHAMAWSAGHLVPASMWHMRALSGMPHLRQADGYKLRRWAAYRHGVML